MTRLLVCLATLLALGACASAAVPGPTGSVAMEGRPAEPPQPATLRPYRLPEVEEFRLANGLRVVVLQQSTLPLVTARVIVDAGAEHEPVQRNGLAVLTGSLLAEGTRSLSAAELAERMERLGAQLQTGGSHSLGFAMVTALKAAMPEALRLAAAAVIEPSFPQAEFERVRQQAIASHAQSRATVEGLASETFNRAVFAPDAPYARPPGGTAESLRAITRDEVVEWHRARYAPGTTTLLLVGDVSGAEARELAESAFGSWSGRSSPDARRPSQPRAVAATRVILVDRPGSVQSAIRVGQAGLGHADADFFSITAFSQVLGGAFNARINQNLRERHGWTYGAFTSFQPLRDAGTLAISSSVRTNATDSALVESVREYRQMLSEPVPEDELHAALNNLIGSFPTSVMTVQGLAQRMQTVLLYGLPMDYLATYPERLAEVTPPAVLDAGGRRLDGNALTIVVAGDLASIETSIRALGLGEVEVWSPSGERLR